MKCTISVGKEELKNRLSSFWGGDSEILALYKYDIITGRNMRARLK